MRDPIYFGNMMLQQGDADGLIAGLTMSYPETIRPALQIHKTREGISRAAGIYLLLFEDRMLFIADTTVNQDPNAEELAEIAWLAGQVARELFRRRAAGRDALLLELRLQHRLAITEGPRRGRHRRRSGGPIWSIEGEMQADTAVEPSIAHDAFPSRGSRETPTSWSAPISSRPTSPTSCCGGSARSRPSVPSSPGSTPRFMCSSAEWTSTTS